LNRRHYIKSARRRETFCEPLFFWKASRQGPEPDHGRRQTQREDCHEIQCRFLLLAVCPFNISSAGAGSKVKRSAARPKPLKMCDTQGKFPVLRPRGFKTGEKGAALRLGFHYAQLRLLRPDDNDNFNNDNDNDNDNDNFNINHSTVYNKHNRDNDDNNDFRG
jgi:hypothetical protein